MYLRWAERHGYKTEILDFQAGEEAGVRERDPHRVRASTPSGTSRRRRACTAWCASRPSTRSTGATPPSRASRSYPELDDSIEIEIDEKDLRVDTYRAGGAGGQHVNKTDSAVRLTHLPTGIVVQCQSERSQHKNRSQAMKVLRARLYERARREQEEKLAALRGDQKEIGFGSQIRSYTLHPTQRVKDHRTDVEIGNAAGVLDGDIDRFIRATLLQRAGGGPARLPRTPPVSEQERESRRARLAGAASGAASTRFRRASAALRADRGGAAPPRREGRRGARPPSATSSRSPAACSRCAPSGSCCS